MLDQYMGAWMVLNHNINNSIKVTIQIVKFERLISIHTLWVSQDERKIG